MTSPRRINVTRMRKNVGLPPVPRDRPEVDEHGGMRAITDLTGEIIRWVPDNGEQR